MLRPESIKLLEENIGRKILDIGLAMISWAPHQKHRQRKAKIDAIKIFCTAKETINKLKRQPREWEKIFAKCISKQELLFNISEEVIQFNSKREMIQFKKMDKETEEIFS